MHTAYWLPNICRTKISGPREKKQGIYVELIIILEGREGTKYLDPEKSSKEYIYIAQ